MRDGKSSSNMRDREIVKHLRFNDFRRRSADEKGLDQAIIEMEMVNAELRFLNAKKR